jgi:hypothetical protein
MKILNIILDLTQMLAIIDKSLFGRQRLFFAAGH